MSLVVQQGLTAASSGGLTVDSQQPTSDVDNVTSTGFSGCKVVNGWFAFTNNNSGRTYTVQARASGGTWRTLFSFTGLADATSSIAGSFSIANFNVATEKIVSFESYTSATPLDDSNATNTINTAGVRGVAYVAQNEIWDEVKIVADSATPIEGSTADQRGRWYVAGEA